jgi:hypothetical protein
MLVIWLTFDAEGRDLAKHFNCKFIETSAKNRINVDEAFWELVREIRRHNKVRHLLYLAVYIVAHPHSLIGLAGWSS